MQEVLPAYAGMIPGTRHAIRSFRCAPRVCGDDPTFREPEDVYKLCSPRMRG